MLVKPIFKVLDLLQVPKILETILHLLVNVTRLTPEELEAAGQVLGPTAINYSATRVGQGRFLPIYFMINRDRATTLFHTVLLPSKGRHTRGRLDLFVHELVHVYQFEKIGSVYLLQAIMAQMGAGYWYGGVDGLEERRKNGKTFSDFNREQQGQVAQDYYDDVLEENLAADSRERLAFQPFIDELQAGKL
jgi:hypothetical protein